MEKIPSFNELIEKSIIEHWDRDALTDYKGKTLQYHDVARKIEKLHIMFEASGVKRGDKIALCGRNSSAWAASFLAVLTYGAVAVPILHEFMPEQIHNIVNHSDAKLLFVGDVVVTQIDAMKMPNLEGIIYIPDYSLVVSRTDKLTYAREHLNEEFGRRYPKYFRPEHIHYYREQVYQAFGGNLYEIIIGGAALNGEIESFLRRIEFPYTVGYGATECGPIICYRDWKTFKQGSCGQAALHQEVRINSSDPVNVPGEILTKGPNVLLGYYKNEEDTGQTIDKDGWFHTGDLGLMDEDGNVFIKGRSKNMLLGSNGQNIYPEEIEDKLNSLPLVSECLVIQSGEKLIALVHPDYDEAQNLGLNADDLKNIMEENRTQLNTIVPAYCKVAEIRIQEEEFEKTPKKSIKRFLYTE